MMRPKNLFIVGALLALATTALAFQDAFSLRVNPKAGESFKYRFTGTLTLMGTDVKADYTQVTKILESSATALVTESGETKGTIDFGGQQMEMPDTGSTKSTVDAGGVLTKLEGEGAGPEAFRSGLITTVFRPEAPVKVGDEWTWTAAASAEKGNRAISSTFKLEAIEDFKGIKSARIAMTVKETEGTDPASAEGKIWINVANGVPVKTEVKVKNFPIPGAPEPISGTLNSEILP